MTSVKTPKEAIEMLCPLSRSFGDTTHAGCRGGSCAVWRWAPHDAKDPRFVAAVSEESERLSREDEKGRKPPVFHKTAVANVMADRAAHGLPTAPERGWCGLGGEPRV